MEKIKQIETEIWVANPEKPGYLKLERKKSIKEVFEELKDNLEKQGVYGEMDYFQISTGIKKEQEFPDYHTIACFAKAGGSEGLYIYVDVVSSDRTETFFLGKTFMGIEQALKVSNLCTLSFYK